jgi:hypothetical protein
MAITILGQHISLIRPKLITKPLVTKRGSATRASRPKKVKLSLADKLSIARSMGYALANANFVCNTHNKQQEV